MSFLSPWTILIAGSLTIPPLIAFYFLKLRRVVHVVPTTLLWRRAVEDMHVNAPFQRLRNSLLLILQLLVLILGAIALGKPMRQTAQMHDDVLILLIDQSASMAVVEEGGRSRLQLAKEQAKRIIDNMGDGARAMVITFCDRASVVSSFDSDREMLKRKIDSIEQTESTSSMGEAVSLAEAFAQKLIIGGDEAGTDIAPDLTAPPTQLFVLSDGRIEDGRLLSMQQFDVSAVNLINVAKRTDNVGILAMDARRDYEQPEWLEVAATIANFGSDPVSVDVVLYMDGQHRDVKTIQLDPRIAESGNNTLTEATKVIAFDPLEYEAGGAVEILLKVEDALESDNRAWTMIEAPRHLKVLLVSPGAPHLEMLLKALPIDLTLMTPDEYESAGEDQVTHGRRSAFDVVFFDRHSTDRLPLGNYFFWGCIPRIEGVSSRRTINNEIIFNWDETHPILRHVGVETLFVFEWLELQLPQTAEVLIEGQSSPVLVYFVREGSHFLISAFSLYAKDDAGVDLLNTPWVVSLDFLVFMQNAVNFLGAQVGKLDQMDVLPGKPVSLPLPKDAQSVSITRPDGKVDRVSVSDDQTVHYARTRAVGPYRMNPGIPGRDRFAVNLFNETESQVSPAKVLSVGTQKVETTDRSVEVNEPAWRYFLMILLALLILEWIVYSKRVFV